MANIALITDTHLGIRNDNPHVRKHIERSFDWFFKTLPPNLDAVIHLGDLFDRRKYLNYTTAASCRQFFLEPLDALGVPSFIIAGNHDVYHTNTLEVNALTEIVGGRYQNISVIVQPKDIEIAGTDILLLPWINEGNQLESFEAIKKSKSSLLMAHLELNGFEMHKGSVMDHGMDIPDLSRFDWVYSGHYHHRSQRDNIVYLGAFADYIWSDFNDPRGYHILDTSSGRLTFFENPNTIHKMIVYDDQKKEQTEILEQTDFSQFTNSFVQIVCAQRTNPYTWDQFVERVSKASPLDISIVQDVEVFKDNEELASVNEAEDTLTILDQYISGLTIPVDHNKMKNYMRELYAEAISVEHVE